MYQVQYTDTAFNDLNEIAGYIAQDSLERAISFTFELQEHFENVLSSFPEAGLLYDERNGIRTKSHKGYTAFYRVIAGDIVEVINVFNLRKPLEARGIDFS